MGEETRPVPGTGAAAPDTADLASRAASGPAPVAPGGCGCPRASRAARRGLLYSFLGR